MDAALAERLFKAYRKGLLLRPPGLWESRARPFDVLFRQLFWLKVPVLERVPVAKIWRLGFQGVRLSRESRLEEACAVFREGWAELERVELSPQGLLLAITFLESAHAYLDYKQGSFDRARDRVLRSMEADLQLEADADFNLLELHRIQSAQNLMRIDLKAGEPRRALDLAGRILAYTEGFLTSLPVHHSWQSEKILVRTPRPIRRALIGQVANDVALAFVSLHSADLESEFLAHSAVAWYFEEAGVLHEQLRLWFLARQAFHREHWDRYLELLLDFLPAGRGDIQTIWYSTMIDLLAVCRSLDSQAALGLHDRILLDVPKWSGVPRPLQALLGLAEVETRAQPHLQAAGFGAPASPPETSSRPGV